MQCNHCGKIVPSTSKICMFCNQEVDPNAKYIPPEEDYVFAFQNKDDKIPFLGVVDIHFKRFGYCLNTYINGDIYFGYYLRDIIHKKGLYSFNPKVENDYKLSQYYLGTWENNEFEGMGI